jgi:hypothetical protein
MRTKLLYAGASLLALAASMPAHAAFKIGSGNTAVIEPPVIVPKETPCIVPLTDHVQFGANNADFSYTPPAACPGPWAKVVLDVEVNVQKGIQYDRTGTLWMGGVPLWFGTTSEPNPKLGPAWHFERDVTDYTALFNTAQTGFELITNYTSGQIQAQIFSSASLKFYPPTPSFPAPKTADMVLPLSAAGGGTVALNTPTDTLSTTVTLPTNVKSASLALYLQGQSDDEFWYTCVPNALTTELESCGGGAAREGEITVDNVPAGVAPIYPWIFTGGIDPYLWSPVPGVETLSFTPFTVPLSPFAGVLSNGAPHTIAVSVYGANSYFSAAGAIFVTLDPTTPAITGSVISNTLAAAPIVTINPKINQTGSTVTGTLNTNARHNFVIVGQINTAAGLVTNKVTETTSFTNDQVFNLSDSKFLQKIVQKTLTSVDEQSIAAGGNSSESRVDYTYPLSVIIDEVVNAKGKGVQATTINQQRLTTRTVTQDGQPTNQSSTANAIATTDDLLINFVTGSIVGNKNQAETATLLKNGTNIPCVSRTLTAAGNVLTSATLGCKK